MFNESDHPRAKNGEFTNKNGGGNSAEGNGGSSPRGFKKLRGKNFPRKVSYLDVTEEEADSHGIDGKEWSTEEFEDEYGLDAIDENAGSALKPAKKDGYHDFEYTDDDGKKHFVYMKDSSQNDDEEDPEKIYNSN